MGEEDLSFSRLIPDLQNIICEYSFGCTAKTLRADVRTAVMIRSWQLPDSFLLQRVKSSPYPNETAIWVYRVNPVYEFCPSHMFMGWKNVFDWGNIYFLLSQFDFRLRIVKAFGVDRHLWYNRIKHDWRELEILSIFFKTCQKSATKILKPTGNPLPVWFTMY